MTPDRSCLERMEDYLGRAGVAYEVTAHPVRYTAQGVAQVEHLPGRLVAKVVMVLLDDRLAMIVAPAPSRVDLDWVRESTGARQVRLAREEEFRHLFADCEVGAMPPFGHLYGLPLTCLLGGAATSPPLVLTSMPGAILPAVLPALMPAGAAK